jgi:hypothetical protein
MLFFLALLPESVAAPVKKLDPLFWLESGAIVAFGISWLTKGEILLKDGTWPRLGYAGAPMNLRSQPQAVLAGTVRDLNRQRLR